eukprot:TRINITY_DN10026_c0_g4_i2.p1 TRINITY_DN10026_c0_g4~~TRINITY_DN10026_c0_g4_i2.p1  ORF type:complete len:208 (+),score=58.80 TRINITY_DN10026_c0_g4_i2:197-820(+)
MPVRLRRPESPSRPGKWHYGIIGVMIVLNLIVAILGLASQHLKYANLGVNCTRPAGWLMVTVISAVISIAALVYTARKLAAGGYERPSGSPSSKDREGPFYKLLVYDYVVYVYVLYGVFMLVWNFLPAYGPWIVGSEKFPIEACETINHNVALARVLVGVYHFMLLAVFVASVCYIPGSFSGAKKRRARPARTSSYEQELVAVEMAE